MSMEIFSEDKINYKELVKLRYTEVSSKLKEIADNNDDKEEDEAVDQHVNEKEVVDVNDQDFEDDSFTEEEEVADSCSRCSEDNGWEGKRTLIKADKLSQSGKFGSEDNVKIDNDHEELSKCIETANNLNLESHSPKKQLIGNFQLKMLLIYSREFLCILALILTTYATLQNRQQKIAKAVPSKPLFSKNSNVQEWANGNLIAVQNHVSASELSLVLFYAPWCAESLFAKHSYEKLANFYSKEAYFAAINCWQPEGECRAYYSKVHRWPVLMAYLPRGLAVEYNGPWSFTTLSKFIDNLMQPIRRIHDQNDLLRLKISNDIVVLAVFDNVQSSKHYQTYFQTAFKWLEHDHLQNAKFAVYIGAFANNFNVTTVPALKMYLWNQEIKYNDTNWSVDSIHTWIRYRIFHESIWVTLPSGKSSTLAGYFQTKPTLVMFAPRNHLFDNNDSHLMLKQVSYLYKNCNNDTNIRLITRNIPFLRKETQNKLEKLKKYCPIILKQKTTSRSKNCASISRNSNSHITCSTLTNASHKGFDIFGGSPICHAKPMHQKMPSVNSYCEIDPPYWIPTTVFRPRRKKSNYAEKFIDHRSPKALLKSVIRTQCKKIEMIQHNSEFEDYTDFTDNEYLNFEGTQCRFNSSLSFLMLDSLQHNEYLKKFAADAGSITPLSSSIFIVDNERESTYMMKSIISLKNVLRFIEDFHQGELTRELKSSAIKYNPNRAPSDKLIQIEEISSVKFIEIIKWTNSTSVVFFHTPHCAFCNMMSQVLLHVAKIMRSMSVNFYRIDGYQNDLVWEYTMNTYPALIIFPKNKSAYTKLFPSSMKINKNNILGFIVANLEPLDRLQALTHSCMLIKLNIPFANCIKSIQHTVMEEIKNNLVLWQKQTKHRSEILQRLIVYKRVEISLLRAKQACDLEIVIKDIASIRYCN